MPKIKAYVGAGALIPVDVAKVKTAYSCPWTKRVFRNKRDYVAHLRHLRRTRMHANIARKQHDLLLEDLTKQSSFEDVIRWINLHPDFMWRTVSITEPMPLGFGIKITYLGLNYNTEVSNSHRAPRGGVTNWRRNEKDKDGNDKPKGYPGWSGNIEFTMTGEKSSVHFWASDLLSRLGIHTGTGGGISNGRYGYSCIVWADDWPALRMMRALKDDDSLNHVRIGKVDYFK